MMENAGQPWSDDQDIQLDSLCRQGHDVTYIAGMMGRTTTAIECRLEKKGMYTSQQLYRSGWTPAQITQRNSCLPALRSYSPSYQQPVQAVQAPYPVAPVINQNFAAPFNQIKEAIMNNTVTTQVMVGTRVADSIEIDELLGIIETEEAFIKRLQSLTNKTPSINKHIKKHQDNVKKLTQILSKKTRS